MVSIIIRTKNEERWIALCLKEIFSQDYEEFEVILVDSGSTDKTILKAKNFAVKILEIDDYLPGKALNHGIRASKGEFLCFISGHCIPVTDKWLSNLVRNFDDKSIAGVYGRQEPLMHTNDFDKRDLVNMFGLDKKIQVKDSFFHNANSMIRRDCWEKTPFDDKVTNIEDRVWAKEILRQGHKIAYEPEASVYHYHGIHQDNDSERCYNVVKILESLQLNNGKSLDAKNLNIVALIPVKGNCEYLNGRPLIEYTIERCKESRFINEIVCSTDNRELANIANSLGAKTPFLRSKDLSTELVGLEQVLQFSLEELEKQNIIPDVLVILEVTYPFREEGLLDTMIQQLLEKGFDTVIPARTEYKSCWIKGEKEIKRIDEGFMPRALKQPFYVGLVGLGCITYPHIIREGRRLGDKVGIVEIINPYSSIEVRGKEEIEIAGKLMEIWWPQQVKV